MSDKEKKMKKLTKKAARKAMSQMTTPPVPSADELAAVDAFLRCWVKSAGGLLKQQWDTRVVNTPSPWTVEIESLVRMLHNLAHCAQLVVLQDLAAGRSEDSEGGRDYTLGFLLAARVIQFMADKHGIKEVTVCSGKSDPYKVAAENWDKVEKTREHVINDIERLAPGWYALVQAKIREAQEAAKASVKPRTAACNPKYVHRPKKGFSDRVARNQAKCFAKGKPTKNPKHGGFKPEDFK